MTETIIQAVIEATIAAIMALREVGNPVIIARSVNIAPRSSRPVLKESTFDCKVVDEYQELCNFEIEVKNIFMTNSSHTQESERVLIILNWLGWEGLGFVQTLKKEKQDKYRTNTGLFEVLGEKFKLQDNKTVLSLQYCKVIGEQNEKSEEWIGHLRIKVNECEYKENEQ